MRKKTCRGLIAVFLMASGLAQAADIELVLSSNSSWNQSLLAGFKNAFPADFGVYNLEENDLKQTHLGKQLQANKPKAVVVVGDFAAQMAKLYLAEIPVVYCDAISASKDSLTKMPAVGIYLEPDPAQQIKTLAAVFPDKKRVGLLYCPDYSSINRASLNKKAGAAGIALEIVPIKTIHEVPDELTVLLSKIDLIWVLADSSVLSRESMEFIVLQSISAKKPIFCGCDRLVRIGATAALVPNPEDVGAKAALEAKKILAGSSPPPGTLVYPRGRMVLNQNVARLLNISFPEELLVKADEVIEY